MVKQGTDGPEEGFFLGALVAIVSDGMRKYAEAGFRSAGYTDLRPAHYPVFAYLSAEGDRVSDLAKRAGMTKQAMGYLVEYLETQGYLERGPHPTDRRAQLVQRTARGWEVNRLARRLAGEVQAAWARELGAERMQQLVATLRDLAELIGVQYRGSVPEIAARQDHALRQETGRN